MIATDKTKIVSLIAAIIKDPLKLVSLSATAKKEIRIFVGELYFQCTKEKTLPANISLLLHEPQNLVRYASQLIIYKASLGEVGAKQQLFDNSYEEFIRQSEFFKKGLHNGNPFILRAHLVHIYHLAQSEKLSEKEKLALTELLENSQNYITAMNSKSYSRFKSLIDGYAKYTAAFLFSSLTSKDKSGELADNVERLYLAAQKSLEMVSKMSGSDTSMALYGHQEMTPKFPFADSDELICIIKNQTHNSVSNP